jgi:hypothetical protein
MSPGREVKELAPHEREFVRERLRVRVLTLVV